VQAVRTKDLKVGDKLIYGKRTDLVLGRGGEEVYVLAVGYWTETYGPCGVAVRPYTSKYKHDRPRIVIARQTKRYGYDGYEMVWQPKVVSTQSVMDPAEYRVKAGVVEKQRRQARDHQLKGQRAMKEAAAEIAAALGIPAASIHWRQEYDGRTSERHHAPHVQLGPAQIAAMLEGKKKTLKALTRRVREWEAEPKPNECRL
jgi:hypothetical protein